MIVARVSTDGQTVDAQVNGVARRQSREDFSRDGQRSQDRPARAGKGATRVLAAHSRRRAERRGEPPERYLSSNL